MTKKILFAIALLIGVSGSISAQDFKATLGSTVAAFFSSKDHTEKINQSNRLGLIAKKFNDQWSADYYAALSKIMLNYEEENGDKKDAYLDEAEDFLATAETLSDKENKVQQSEIYALKAMIANARIAIAPQKRYQKYGKIFEDNLDLAKQNNESNPRIYFLKGTSTLFTPKMFGGGGKKALPYFEKAQGYFEKQATDDITVPFWGKETNEQFMKQAQGDN